MNQSKIDTIKEISNYLLYFFKDEPHKAIFWLLELNPLLGNVRPCDMINADRHEKLLKFIKDTKDGNLP